MSLSKKYVKPIFCLSLILMLSITFLAGCSTSGDNIFNNSGSVVAKQDLDIEVSDRFQLDETNRARALHIDANAKPNSYVYFTVFVRPNKNTVPNSKYRVDVIYKKDNTICSGFTISIRDIPSNLDKIESDDCDTFLNRNSQPMKDYYDDIALPVKDRKNISPKNMFDFKITNLTTRSVSSSPTIPSESVINKTAEQVSLSVTYPKGGEKFRAGDVITITWESTNLLKDQPVVITYELPSGARTYITVPDGVPNTGSYKWIIPSKIIIGTQIKIYTSTFDSNGRFIADSGSGYFTIME